MDKRSGKLKVPYDAKFIVPFFRIGKVNLNLQKAVNTGLNRLFLVT